MDGQTDARTNERRSPCVLRNFIPFGAAAQKAFVGGHEDEGFEYYENLQNCGDFADYCNVYTNQTTGVNQFNCIPLTDLLVGLEVTGPGDGNPISLIIRLGTSDTPEQKKFCPKIAIQLIDFNGARRNDGSRRMKAYLGYLKEEYNTVSEGNKNYQVFTKN